MAESHATNENTVQDRPPDARSHTLSPVYTFIGGGKNASTLPTRISSAWPSQDGTGCWEFLWWAIELTGHRVRRKAVIGTVQQYPNIEAAWQASNGLRVSINEARNRAARTIGYGLPLSGSLHEDRTHR